MSDHSILPGVADAHCLEPARASDAEALARLSRRHVENGLGWRWTPPRLAACIQAEDTEVVLARGAGAGGPASPLAGVALGFAVMEYRFAVRRAHLVLLAVAPAQRRNGLGRRLVDWCEAMARLGGIREIALEVRESNAGARAFYATLGYVGDERLRGYYQGVEDAVRLRKNLERRRPSPLS